MINLGSNNIGEIEGIVYKSDKDVERGLFEGEEE
jgi:hypothetical protein